MTDAFAEMGFDWRFWMDPAELNSRYHALAIDRHPDKCGGDPKPLARLNAARSILASTPARLRHLLSLSDLPLTSDRPFAPDFDLFSRVGMLTRRAAELSNTRERVTPGLAKVVLETECASLSADIALAMAGIESHLLALQEKIRALDQSGAIFESQTISPIIEEFSFFEKWRQSLHEARTLLRGG